MWYFEYKIGRMLFRFPADDYEACVTALLVARASSPLMRDPKIFHGGTIASGTGAKVFDQHETVGSPGQLGSAPTIKAALPHE